MIFKFSIFNFQFSNKKGFTLIELLVAISVIALLLSVGISSYSTVQRKGRDAKRKSDIHDIRNSMEQYYTVCSFSYPTPTGNIFGAITCLSPSIAIMPTVPWDPRGTPYYCPTIASGGNRCSASSYQICTRLESEPTPEFCMNNTQ